MVTPHARLDTDLPGERAADIAWIVEDLYLALAHVFGACDSLEQAPPVQLTVFARASDYRGVAPPGTGAFYFAGGGQGLVIAEPRIVIGHDDLRHLRTLVVHELTHRFVALCIPFAPVWLNEGLAVYYETLRVGSGEIAVGLAPFRLSEEGAGTGFAADGRWIDYVAPSWLVPASELLAMSPSVVYGRAAGGHAHAAEGHYASAWGVVHYLELGPDPLERSRFSDYLGLLSRDTRNPSDAFARVFGGALDARVAAYLSAWDLSVRHVPYAAPRIGEPMSTPMFTSEIQTRWAELWLGNRSGRGPALEHLSAAGSVRSLLLRAVWSEGAARDLLIATARERGPDDLDVLHAVARLALVEPNGDDASTVVSALGRRTDLRALDRVALGWLLLARSDLLAAEVQATQAVARAPTEWEAQLLLGAARGAAGNYTHAIAPLRAAIALAAHHIPDGAEHAQRLLDLAVALGIEQVSAPTPVPEPPPP